MLECIFKKYSDILNQGLFHGWLHTVVAIYGEINDFIHIRISKFELRKIRFVQYEMGAPLFAFVKPMHISV